MTIFRLRRMAIPAALLAVAVITILSLTAAAQTPTGAKLPLKRVVLFTSGVGFFDRLGEVEGNAGVELKFNVDDVNDLLKSMVVQDFGGGRVGTVTYGSRDPVTKTLRTFAIDLTRNPSLADLLEQVRGEELVVEAPTAIIGRLIGVERGREVVIGEQKVKYDMLVLLTDRGLARIPLDTVNRLRLVNPKLDAELKKALAVLALGNATDKKTVTCEFLGEGKRRVRIAYVQEAPIWKTSYRLVLDNERAPFLQGWAMVENTTEEDWEGVDLTLVSGRPISFVMDLYRPLYLKRPVVQLETHQSVRPPVHESGRPQEQAKKPSRRKSRDRNALGISGGARGRRGGRPGAPPAPTASPTPSPAREPMELGRGVTAAATGAEVGELFQYRIDSPVTLARQRSAMLPILNADVAGEKVSLYNPRVHAVHPLNAFKLENTSGLHLMQGPITVFDGGAYAGDARIRDLAPGETRLLSYALDLEAEVKVERPSQDERLVSMKLVKGVAYVARKYLRTTVYKVKNAGRREKVILVEHHRDSSWKRTFPEKADDASRTYERFRVTAAAGAAAELRVKEERVYSRTIALTSLRGRDVAIYLESKEISQGLKDAMVEVARRKAEIDRLRSERSVHQNRVRGIERDQKRIREMMKNLDRTAELYHRYLAKLTKQEDQIEAARAKMESLTLKENEKRRGLEAYLAGLDIPN